MRFIARLTFALVLAAPAAAFAQQPSPQQPPAQPAQQQPTQQQPAQQPAADPGRKFAGQAGILFNIIKPEKTADFEAFLAKLHESLQKSADPVRKQQAASWKVYKMSEPDGRGNVMYLYFVDPAVAGADYTATRIIAETLPSEAQALYEKIKDAFAGQSIANLSLVADFSKPLQ
ncbi:MAG TPA: hypothetical protein VK886_05330 [Vicinamibacterales bacterium]|nr:hypothetical protein [Vicinamibacterales bacterium]